MLRQNSIRDWTEMPLVTDLGENQSVDAFDMYQSAFQRTPEQGEVPNRECLHIFVPLGKKSAEGKAIGGL